jgi:putative cell wall-binding protein
LAVSPFAYSQGIPVLLVRVNELPAATSAKITALGIDELVIAGGTAAVSAAVEAALGGLAGVTDVTRVAGANRYDTAVDVAEYGVTEGWGSFGFVGVTTGKKFPDALGGGAVCGSRGGVLLLTDPNTLSPEVATALAARKAEVSVVQIFGGAGAVSEAVATAIDAALE